MDGYRISVLGWMWCREEGCESLTSLRSMLRMNTRDVLMRWGSEMEKREGAQGEAEGIRDSEEMLV